MKSTQLLILLASAALFAGCATVTPKELADARSAYQVASDGPATQLAPAELHKAHEALALAEKSFQDEPESYKTKDLAYAAQRKSQQAGALGYIAADKADKVKANADFQKKQGEIVKQGKQDLSDSEKRTADARAELDRQAELKAVKEKSDADIQQGQKELRESQKRTAEAQAELDKQAALKAAGEKADAELLQGKLDLRDSENRAATALADLAALAALKEEERGLVLTLSGGVLFRSAESILLPSAQVKLDQVATALLAIRARNLIVEGHTDSQGSDSYNQGLSQRRADAVRDYLVLRGYPADRIQARGRGEGSPIAANSSPEGRANNRRVEIVIERELKASSK
ncbi:MAG: OmpA family protein [Desulfuromonadales bacterium]